MRPPTADTLFDTTAVVLSCIMLLAMMLRMVWVFPVPGGPCTTLSLSEKARSTAFFWLALRPKG